MINILQLIATELAVQPRQVTATVALLDDGATVPFISRYRKEVTGGLDDTQLRYLDERLRYLRELEDRKGSILKAIDEQGKLTDSLKKSILSCVAKNTLEDLYLPYKKKRRTKGQIAIEAGIEPLADALFSNPELAPEEEALKYINAEQSFADIKAVLDGAKYILMERFAEDASLIAKLRTYITDNGHLISVVTEGKEAEAAKFRDYFDYSEPYRKVPSHRALAVYRGRNEGFLQIKIDLPVEGDVKPKLSDVHPAQIMIAEHLALENLDRAADRWLSEVVRWTWRIKLHTHIETDLMTSLREKAEEGAISVFADNLKDLLLAAPAGAKATIGLDPGLRTGCKVAVVDHTGKLLDHCAIYPTPPQNKIAESAAILINFAKKYNVELVAIGNGTASRETDKFVGDIIKEFPELKLKKVIVNEAGASIYSASEFAAKEFPDLDVTIRGAVSIARRLQDPLAELVKLEPKSIGVGQYQHDVSQVQLARSLDGVVEDCVNGVGVDVNMASVALLKHVSGLNSTIAQNIVDYRDANGVFASRESLKKVARFGDKTFEQAAGFLRIRGGNNPLDNSSVHPEAYQLVESMSNKTGKEVVRLLGDSSTLKSIKAGDFVTERFGLPTIKDILSELQKPGRDPRPEFKTADFKEGVEKISDLKPSMILEGTVTNVTNFGAFIDIGVHQDGLVHISAMSEEFISDPREVVKAGDIVKVKVMEVDVARKRVGLSMRMSDDPETLRSSADKKSGKRNAAPAKKSFSPKPSKDAGGAMGGAFAAAFANAKNK